MSTLDYIIKMAMKKLRICHFIQLRDQKWFSIKLNSFLCFFNLQSMAEDEVWNEAMCFSTNQRIFYLEGASKFMLHSPPLTSSHCSCLISEAPGLWFPSLFLSTFSEQKLIPLRKEWECENIYPWEDLVFCKYLRWSGVSSEGRTQVNW